MHKTLELSVREQAYVATCFTIDGQPLHEERQARMQEIRDNLLNGKDYSFSLLHNHELFPELFRCRAEGVFAEHGSVQQYFEGLGPESHNARLYRQLLVAGEQRMSDSELQLLLDHAESCSVRVAWLPHGLMRTFRGLTALTLDTSLGAKSEYLFVHGMNEGLPAAVAEATKEQFSRSSRWFTGHGILSTEYYRALIRSRSQARPGRARR